MHEPKLEQGITERPTLRAESIFSGPPRYPLDAETPRPISTATPATSRRHVLTRIVLPLVLFVAAIAVIAWITQYLPSRGRTPDVQEPAKVQAIAQFAVAVRVDNSKNPPEVVRGIASKGQPLFALWDPARPNYPAAEYEIAWGGFVDNGYYDFEVDNPSDMDVVFGVLRTNCACSSVQACVLTAAEQKVYQNLKKSAVGAGTYGRETFGSFTWQTLKLPDESIVLPPRASGVLRAFWDGSKKQQPEPLTLKIEVWTRAKAANVQDATVLELFTHVRFDRPALIYPPQLDVGKVGGSGAAAPHIVWCWSATRDITVTATKGEPCIGALPVALSSAECRQLEKELEKQFILTKIRCAYRVDVTVHEQQGDAQLDLGWFQRRLPITIKSQGEDLDVPLPLVQGMVQGEVRLVAADRATVPQNMLRLEPFRKEDGLKCKVILSVQNDLKLEYVKCEPARLDVDVKLSKKTSEGAVATWEMDLHFKPGQNEAGELPDNCVLILRSPGLSRQIRIRLIGRIDRG